MDISHRGVRLALGAALPVGGGVDLEIKLLDTPKVFRLRSTVLWIAPSPLGGSALEWECGAVFGDSHSAPAEGEITALMANEACKFLLQSRSDQVCRPAGSLGELKAAYRLVYKEHLARSYCISDPSEMHYDFFCILPEACTFILEREEEILGTLTLVVDSPLGLPFEAAFPGTLAKLRSPHRRFAEVILLALNREAFGRGQPSLARFQKQLSLFRLLKTVFDYARTVAGVTDLVIRAAPKQETFCKTLTFETIGPARPSPDACGRQMLPMRMDIGRSMKGVPEDGRIWQYFVKAPTPKEFLERRFHLTSEMVRELLVEMRPLWPTIPFTCQEHLQACYPSLVASLT